MTIPFDADWRRVIVSADAGIALAGWATLQPGLAGADLDTVRERAASRDVGESDIVLSARLRLAATELLARRTIVESLMARLLLIVAALARASGDHFDDVLVELAGWVWSWSRRSRPTGSTS